MSEQKLTAFEQAVMAGLAHKASLAATLLDAWSEMPVDSVQTARSLVDAAQLGVTEEAATQGILLHAVSLGLAERAGAGFKAGKQAHAGFKRLAFALHVVDHYQSRVHQDATIARVVLTKPAAPSVLERRLSDLGWRTADLELTERAFCGMVRAARRRLVVMTPFFDQTGANWLRELISLVAPEVECILILRSLEAPTRSDFPSGLNSISQWLRERNVRVFNYSIPRPNGAGRETFHAKVVLCDRNIAYVGSSNLTAASLEYSMEIGVVLSGRSAADVGEVIDAVLASASQIS